MLAELPPREHDGGAAGTAKEVAMSDDVTGLHQRLQALEREVRVQRRIGALGALLICAVLLAGWQAPERQRFTELDVERLNVIEPDGELVLVLANTERLPDPLIAGNTVETARTGPGMIFFDGKGWEVGGLTYSTRETEDGYRASGHLSFDQFRNDQVVYLNYADDGTSKAAGLYVVDRAREPHIDELLRMRDEMANATEEERRELQQRLAGSAAQRIFVGSRDDTAMVRLRDRDGRDRIRMFVDDAGTARLDFLDGEGNIVQSFPPAREAAR